MPDNVATKLTACLKCKWREPPPDPEYSSPSCQHPDCYKKYQWFDSDKGKWITLDERLPDTEMSDLNSDGHCQYYEPKEEKEK